jgi:DNA-binding SARP family transcriptional activator
VLEFRVLGPLEVRRDGEPLTISAPKQRALLGLLLLHAGEPVAQDVLIEQLWGEDAPPTARASLQNYVHALRTLLGAEVVERRPAGYVVNVDPEHVDLSRFERLIAEARQAEPRERAAKLRQALSCWRGPALVDFPNEPFAQHEIGRLEEERLTALEDRIEAELELGRPSDLVAELEGEVERHPLRERLWAQLMLALYRAGRQADALAAYGRAHETFAEELGVEPAFVLRDLHRAILIEDPALHDGESGIGSMLERAAAILPKPPRERAESLYEYAVALLRTGHRRQAVSTFAAAERLAGAAVAPDVEERARLYQSYVSVWTDGRSPLAHLSDAERAAARLEKLGDTDGLWLSLFQQAQMLHFSGRPDSVLPIAERLAELGAVSEDPSQLAGAKRWLAVALADGATPVAEAISRCEAELAAVRDDEATPFGVWSALIVLYAEAGRIEDSRALGEKAVAEARRSETPWVAFDLMERRSAAEFAAGNLADAIAHLRAPDAVTEGDRAGGLVAAAELSRLLALNGDIDEARPLAAFARAAASPDWFTTEALWRRSLALIAAHDGRTHEALQLSDEACSQTAASDRLAFHGQTLEEAATIRLGAGNPAGAVESLHEALATYEQGGASSVLSESVGGSSSPSEDVIAGRRT